MCIYLDEAATTRPKQCVIDAIKNYCEDKWYNPSCLYSPAKSINADINYARKNVASYINAKPNEIFFTSCGSEGNCWAIQGFVNYCKTKRKEPLVITSCIEHKSIMSCVDALCKIKSYISVDKHGFINIEQLKNMLNLERFKNKTVLVSIQFANNEIGTIQNIKEISDVVHQYGGIFHTDATQAFGKVEIDVKELGIDMLTSSGHKVGTPKGIGFLYKKSSVKIMPLIYGSQMDGMRGGTENVPYIIGMSKAVEILMNKNMEQNTAIRDKLLRRLVDFGCTVNGSMENRLPNNISVILPNNISGEAMLYILDSRGIYISTGSACNSGSMNPSHVLKSIGLTDEQAASTIRISIPEYITLDDVDTVADEIEKAIEILSVKA